MGFDEITGLVGARLSTGDDKLTVAKVYVDIDPLLTIFDEALGLVGAALILLAYAGVQLKKLDPHKPPALLLNLVGAALVLVSLWFEFNLAAALLEAAWVLIALWGLFDWLRGRSLSRGEREGPDA